MATENTQGNYARRDDKGDKNVYSKVKPTKS